MKIWHKWVWFMENLTFNARERLYFISVSSSVSIADHIIHTISDFKYFTVEAHYQIGSYIEHFAQ